MERRRHLPHRRRQRSPLSRILVLRPLGLQRLGRLQPSARPQRRSLPRPRLRLRRPPQRLPLPGAGLGLRHQSALARRTAALGQLGRAAARPGRAGTQRRPPRHQPFLRRLGRHPRLRANTGPPFAGMNFDLPAGARPYTAATSNGTVDAIRQRVLGDPRAAIDQTELDLASGAPATLTIRNDGNGLLAWRIDERPSWLEASADGGVASATAAPAAPAAPSLPLRLTPVGEGVTEGSHYGRIIIAALMSDGTEELHPIPVSLNKVGQRSTPPARLRASRPLPPWLNWTEQWLSNPQVGGSSPPGGPVRPITAQPPRDRHGHTGPAAPRRRS